MLKHWKSRVSTLTLICRNGFLRIKVRVKNLRPADHPGRARLFFWKACFPHSGPAVSEKAWVSPAVPKAGRTCWLGTLDICSPLAKYLQARRRIGGMPALPSILKPRTPWATNTGLSYFDQPQRTRFQWRGILGVVTLALVRRVRCYLTSINVHNLFSLLKYTHQISLEY